jgi:hypothetical protein
MAQTGASLYKVLVIPQACRSVDSIVVVSAWQLPWQFGALLDGKRSGLFCPSQQSWNKPAACHSVSANNILSSCPENSAAFFFYYMRFVYCLRKKRVSVDSDFEFGKVLYLSN